MSAIELNVFSTLASGPLKGDDLRQRVDTGLYEMWRGLTEVLRTSQVQVARAVTDNPFATDYADPTFLNDFTHAMAVPFAAAVARHIAACKRARS